MILPVLLLTIFMVIEIARLLHAWLAVENGARFGIRYAVTGRFDDAYDNVSDCNDFYTEFGDSCSIGEDEKIENSARVLSIRDQVEAGAVGILRDGSLLLSDWDKEGYFEVTVCSDSHTYSGPDLDNFSSNWTASCTPADHAGDPGERIQVVVDFNHPLIVPFVSQWWPMLHLTARRDGLVERFRVSRSIGSGSLPTAPPGNTATSTPSLTPSATVTPSITMTPTATFTASSTVTPSNTPTPSDTPTITNTPTITQTPSETPTPTQTLTPTMTLTPSETPLPSCGGVKFTGSTQIRNRTISQKIVNTTYPGLEVESITVNWPALQTASDLYGWNVRTTRIDYRSSPIFVGADSTSGTTGSSGLPIATSMGAAGNTIKVWWAGTGPAVPVDWRNTPLNLNSSHFGFSVNFSDPACNLSRSASDDTFPLPTVPPPPTATFTPSASPTVTYTPSATATPSVTPTWTPLPELRD